MVALHDEQLAARQELLQMVCAGHDGPVQRAPGRDLHQALMLIHLNPKGAQIQACSSICGPRVNLLARRVSSHVACVPAR